MSISTKTAAAAIAFSMTMGGAGAALAKAHDMGVADGTRTPVDLGLANSGDFVQTDPLGINPGISGVVSGGARGGAASGEKSGNAVEPNGAPGRNR